MASGVTKRKVNPRIFFAGVLVTLLFYGALAGYSYFSVDDDQLVEMETTLASQGIGILRDSSYRPIPEEASVDKTMVGQEPLKENQHPAQPNAHDEHPAMDITEKPEHDVSADGREHQEAQAVSPSESEKHESSGQETAANLATYPALSEAVDGYVVPVKLSHDLPSNFDAYRKNFIVPEGMQGHLYAIVFYDFGLSQKQAEQLLSAMPDNVTIALNPYSDTPAAMRDYLGEHAYESWMMLPMETTMFPARDPGPQGLLSRSSYESNLQKLYWTMSRAQGYAGLVSYTDGAFAEAKPVLGAIAKEIFDRGLGYVDLNSDGNQQIEMIANRYGGPYGQAALNFDKYNDGYSADDFAKLATVIVNNKDGAILVFPMSSQAISMARQAYKLIEANGHVLAPLSYVLVQKPKPEIDLESGAASHPPMNEHNNEHEEPAHEQQHTEHH